MLLGEIPVRVVPLVQRQQLARGAHATLVAARLPQGDRLAADSDGLGEPVDELQLHGECLQQRRAFVGSM
jgi:hypothetical protein